MASRDESPVTTLRGCFPSLRSVLIVDQVDAVSEVSGRNGAVKENILRLVKEASTFGNVTVVLACRTFDLDNDARLKSLREGVGVSRIEVPHLDWERDVEPILAQRRVVVGAIPGNQKELLRLPLNLALFLKTFDPERPCFSSRSELFARLLEQKRREIRTARPESGWDVAAPLVRLAEWMSERQKLDAPEDVLAEFNHALDTLASAGLIAVREGPSASSTKASSTTSTRVRWCSEARPWWRGSPQWNSNCSVAPRFDRSSRR